MRTLTELLGAPTVERLKFGHGNSKLDAGIITYGIPSGHTCPGARECLAKVRAVTVDGYETRRLTDGPHQQYRCFSASVEAAFATVYAAMQHNWRLLRDAHAEDPRDGMYELLKRDVPRYGRYVRVHTHGDYFNQVYFDAWVRLATERPETVFYGYTKSLKYWQARLGQLPDNMVLTASWGGHYDELIDRHKLRSAVVVDHPDTAAALGLEIDHDDSHAMQPGPSFALLIHGCGPAGSLHQEATKRMRLEGIQYSYNIQ